MSQLNWNHYASSQSPHITICDSSPRVSCTTAVSSTQPFSNGSSETRQWFPPCTFILYSTYTYKEQRIFWRAETSTGERHTKNRAIFLQLQHRITELRQAGNLHSLIRPPNFCSQAQVSTCDATMVTGRGNRDPQPASRRIASALSARRI